MKFLFLILFTVLNVSFQVKKSYFYPRSTLPPLNVTNYGNLVQLEEKYINSISNEEILDHLAENSEISNSTSILDYISMKPESIRSRVFDKDPDDWHWLYDNYKKEFVLPTIGKIPFLT